MTMLGQTDFSSWEFEGDTQERRHLELNHRVDSHNSETDPEALVSKNPELQHVLSSRGPEVPSSFDSIRYSSILSVYHITMLHSIHVHYIVLLHGSIFHNRG